MATTPQQKEPMIPLSTVKALLDRTATDVTNRLLTSRLFAFFGVKEEEVAEIPDSSVNSSEIPVSEPQEKTAEVLSQPSQQPTQVVQEEKVMASGVTVQGEIKQNPKAGPGGDAVPGFQSGESASSGPKGNVPVVPGKVVTEGPSLDVLPKTQKTGFELKTDNDSAAKAVDKEIEALKRSKGLVTEKAKLASVIAEVQVIASTVEGRKMIENFLVYAKKKSKNPKLGPKAKDFVGKKIEKLREEGKTPEQSAGQAYGMAREKFGEKAVPEKKD